MAAVIFHHPGDVRMKRVPLPDVGELDVLLRVKAVGICGSDLHTYRTGLFGHDGQVMGHEFCGAAAAVEARVEGVGLGTRWTGYSAAYCGTCYWCTRGQVRMCPELFANYAGYGRPGAMADYVLIKDAVVGTNLFAIPDNVRDDLAAMAEPLGTALYAVRRTKVQPADRVVVIGVGTLGNLTMQAVKTIPNTLVLAIDLSHPRRELARELGADAVVDPISEDSLAAVIGWAGRGRFHFGEGGMADVVIDAAGGRRTFAQALQFVRSLGTVGLLGIPEGNVEAELRLIIHKDIKVVGIFGSVISAGLERIADSTVRVAPLITHRLPLTQAATAFEIATSDPTAVKVMLFP
jgi:threonine dehydrogenase-like Zn-dependent dehydrogenase